jgi:hypothetical protein
MGTGRLQQRHHGGGAIGQDHVGRERDQLRRVSAKGIGIDRRPARVELHIAADGPAQERERLLERPDPGLKFLIVLNCRQEHPDAPHPFRLLRPCRERPRGRRAAEEGDELATLHLVSPNRIRRAPAT